MAALISSDFEIPAEISQGFLKKHRKDLLWRSYPEQDRRNLESSRCGYLHRHRKQNS